MNRLNKRGTIYAGQRLKVPTNNGGIGIVAHNSATQNSPQTTEWRTSASNGSLADYRVRKGDTACRIARHNNMKCAEFLAINGLGRKSLLQIGQRVIVSAANVWHTVRRGQTPCGIADVYGVRCTALLGANRLSRRSTIYVGQRLRVPGRS